MLYKGKYMKRCFEQVTRYVSEWSPNQEINRSEDFQPGFWGDAFLSMDAVGKIPMGCCRKVELGSVAGESRALVFQAFSIRH